jgi:hypothetical protein
MSVCVCVRARVCWWPSGCRCPACGVWVWVYVCGGEVEQTGGRMFNHRTSPPPHPHPHPHPHALTRIPTQERDKLSTLVEGANRLRYKNQELASRQQKVNDLLNVSVCMRGGERGGGVREGGREGGREGWGGVSARYLNVRVCMCVCFFLPLWGEGGKRRFGDGERARLKIVLHPTGSECVRV